MTGNATDYRYEYVWGKKVSVSPGLSFEKLEGFNIQKKLTGINLTPVTVSQ
jgi:hypothetical protein